MVRRKLMNMSANGTNKPEYCEFCEFSYYDHVWNDYTCMFKWCAYERPTINKQGTETVSKLSKEDNK
jgi:hypothetical protein